MRPDVAGDVLEGTNVLGQARAAECAAWPQIIGRNVEFRVGDENLMNSGRANSKLVADAADFIGKSNLYRVKRIIDELRDLCRAISRVEDRRGYACIQLVERLAPSAVLRSNHDLRRIQEIVDRHRFAQELGVVGNLDQIHPASQGVLENREDQFIDRTWPDRGAKNDG